MNANWKPIETAPKDGSRILVWIPGEEMTRIARWDRMEFYTHPKPYWSIERGVSRTRRDRENPPSHWMPLPECPA